MIPTTPQQFVDAAWHNAPHTSKLKKLVRERKDEVLERLATMPFSASADERLGLTARLGLLIQLEHDINNIKSE